MAEEIIPNQSSRVEAPFNMALATLERIHNILEAITNIDKKIDIDFNSKDYLSKASGQSMKIKLVQDLFLQAVPLLKESDIEILKTKVLSLKVKYIPTKSNLTTKVVGEKPIFSKETEKEIFNLIMEIELALQTAVVFMPTKLDRMF